MCRKEVNQSICLGLDLQFILYSRLPLPALRVVRAVTGADGLLVVTTGDSESGVLGSRTTVVMTTE